MTALLTLTSIGTAAAEDTLPFGESHSYKLSQQAGQNTLAIGGYFQTKQRHFGHRLVMATINGKPLNPQCLQSPPQIIAPRCPVHPVWERIDEESRGLRFPLTHHDGGLADFHWSDSKEYDKWVPLYNNFPQTVYLDLSEFPKGKNNEIEVVIANILGRPIDRDGELEQPAFVITELTLQTERPTSDDFGTFIVPIWDVLDKDCEARARAITHLRNESTSNEIKGQILAQFGMLNLMKGHNNKAVQLFQQAITTSDKFPEYNELCFRLLQMTGKPPVAHLPQSNDAPGSWAKLYLDYKKALSGEKCDRVISVSRISEFDSNTLFVPEDLAQADSTTWHPLAHQILGPQLPNATQQTKVAFFYNADYLILLAKGPAAKEVHPDDIPGNDRQVWNHNCIELFLAPQADFTRYYELNVSAGGGHFDARSLWHAVRDPGTAYSGSWQTQVMLADGMMQVAYRIPWSNFGFTGAPDPKELWMANVVRVQFTADKNEEMIQREFSLGKLLWRYFHRIQDGILLQFDED